MTHSIEGIPTTEDNLLRAIKTLATSAMGIEKHLNTIADNLDTIHDRLDGIEDSFLGFAPTGDKLVEVKHSIDSGFKNVTDSIDALCLEPPSSSHSDRDTNLMHIVEQLMSIDRNFQAFCDCQSEKP